jgi:ribosomal protein S27AE
LLACVREPIKWLGRLVLGVENVFHILTGFIVVSVMLLFQSILRSWIQNTEELYAREGWIVHNEGVRNSVFWTVQYLLSHAGVFKDQESSFKPKVFNVTTWIGELAYNKIHTPKLVEEREVCPYCGSVLMQMEDDELGRHPPPLNWEKNQDFLYCLGSGD